jgi:hypothetical protein
MNGERSGGHQPTVETWLGDDDSFAAKNPAARDGGAVRIHSHWPPQLAVFAQIRPARRRSPRRSMQKHFEKWSPVAQRCAIPLMHATLNVTATLADVWDKNNRRLPAASPLISEVRIGTANLVWRASDWPFDIILSKAGGFSPDCRYSR